MAKDSNALDRTSVTMSNGERLLLVEDEAVIRFVLRCELELRGFSVTEAGDGRDALEQFEQDPDGWSGAFVDFRLPDMRGDVIIETFQALRPNMPIVLMTGDLDPHTEQMARERNLEVLRKPFPLERVRPLLSAMVRPVPNLEPGR